MAANLKTAFTADTSDLKKGSADAKAALRDFGKVGEGAMGRLGDLMGVNLGKLKQLESAARGAGMALSSAFRSSGADAEALAKVIGTAGAGAAALGVGAVVLTWKELNAEADYFYQSMEGSVVKSGLDAWKATLSGCAMEMADLQRAVDATAETSKTLGTIWQYIKSGAKGALGFNQAGTTGLLGAVTNIAGMDAAVAKANEAEQVARRIRELQLQQINNQVTIAEYDARIAERKRIAKDLTNDVAVRSQALAEAERLITERKNLQVPILRQLAELQEKLNSYTLTSAEDQQKVVGYRMQAFQLAKQENDQSRELLEMRKMISAEMEKNAAAAERFETAVAGLTDWTPEMEFDLQQMQEEWDAAVANLDTTINVRMGTIELQGTDALKQAEQLQQQVAQTLNAGLTSVVNSAFSGIGSAIGDAISGAGNIGSSLLAVVGKLCTQLGELAIGAGTAVLGIKQSLESLNPWVAIAAGIALVALGTAITGAVSSLASTSSPSSSYSSGGYTIGAGNMDWSSDDRPIEVTGRLEADGNALVAVIERTKKRNRYLE